MPFRVLCLFPFAACIDIPFLSTLTKSPQLLSLCNAVCASAEEWLAVALSSPEALISLKGSGVSGMSVKLISGVGIILGGASKTSGGTTCKASYSKASNSIHASTLPGESCPIIFMYASDSLTRRVNLLSKSSARLEWPYNIVNVRFRWSDWQIQINIHSSDIQGFQGADACTILRCFSCLTSLSNGKWDTSRPWKLAAIESSASP